MNKKNIQSSIHLSSTCRLTSLVCLWIGIVGVVLNSVEAIDKISLEDKTKAAFVYHFTKYIEWPQSDSSETFNIGVLGDSQILKPLEEISRLKKIGNRRIVVSQLDSVQQCNPCHILFISESVSKKFSFLKKYLQNVHTLTIGETKGFAAEGSCVNFITEKGKIRFEINRAALQRMQLTASSQLLKLAKIVEEEKSND